MKSHNDNPDNLEELIENCQSLEDIYRLIDSLEGIYGSYRWWERKKLIRSIAMVESCKYHFNLITRTGGLRKKVMELLEIDSKIIEDWCKGDDSD